MSLLESLYALARSASQEGCDIDLIVVSSKALADALQDAGIEVHFEVPDDSD